MIKRIINSKNIRNSSWMIAERVFQMGINFVVGVLTARFLGPTDFGVLNYTAAFISFFTNIASLSMNSVMVMKLVEKPDLEGGYLGSAIYYRFIAAMFSTISISILIMFLNPHDTTKLALALIQSAQLLFQSFHILDCWFQRKLLSKYVSLGKMGATIIVSLYKIYLLSCMKSVVWFAFSNVISDFVIATILVCFYFFEQGQHLFVRLNYGNELLRLSFHFIISEMMTSAYLYMDRIMLGKLKNDADVGYYSIAISISNMWEFVPVSIINSYKPTIFEIYHSGNQMLYKRRLQQLIAVVFWVSVGFSICICLFGGLVISRLYGSDYINAITPMKILTWADVFGVTSMTRIIWILVENKSEYVKRYIFVGMIVNFVLNIILIPRTGVIGAAVATLLTQFCSCIVAPLFFKDTCALSSFVIKSILLEWFWNK